MQNKRDCFFFTAKYIPLNIKPLHSRPDFSNKALKCKRKNNIKWKTLIFTQERARGTLHTYYKNKVSSNLTYFLKLLAFDASAFPKEKKSDRPFGINPP